MIIEHVELKTYLKHRAPFLLVDRIIHLESSRIVGIKNVSGTDPFLEGHFPDEPILPGVILLEAMSQVGGILVAQMDRFVNSARALLVAVDKVKFRKSVVPGDQVVIEATDLVVTGRFARVVARARVNDEEVATGNVTYFFRGAENT